MPNSAFEIGVWCRDQHVRTPRRPRSMRSHAKRFQLLPAAHPLEHSTPEAVEGSDNDDHRHSLSAQLTDSSQTTGIYVHLQNADMKAALQDYALRRQGKSP